MCDCRGHTHTHTHTRKPHERDSVVQQLHHPYSQSFECWQSEESAWFNTTDHVTPQVPVEAKLRILGLEQLNQQQNTTLIPKRNWYTAQTERDRMLILFDIHSVENSTKTIYFKGALWNTGGEILTHIYNINKVMINNSTPCWFKVLPQNYTVHLNFRDFGKYMRIWYLSTLMWLLLILHSTHEHFVDFIGKCYEILEDSMQVPTRQRNI